MKIKPKKFWIFYISLLKPIIYMKMINELIQDLKVYSNQ
jgi:hypothetical protein